MSIVHISIFCYDLAQIKFAIIAYFGISIIHILNMHISSTWVKIRLHIENWIPRLPRSALKVPGSDGRESF